MCVYCYEVHILQLSFAFPIVLKNTEILFIKFANNKRGVCDACFLYIWDAMTSIKCDRLKYNAVWISERNKFTQPNKATINSTSIHWNNEILCLKTLWSLTIRAKKGIIKAVQNGKLEGFFAAAPFFLYWNCAI